MDDHPALLDALAKLISHAWIRWDNDAGRNTSFIDNLGTFVSCAENAGVSIGDSTVCGFNDPYYYPRYGYGTQMGKYLDSSVTVNNLALSGRSSKSFIDPTDNPNYAVLTSSIKAGDYLIIGFGHNDEKADSSLYTNPNTSGADGTAQLQAWVSDAPTSVDDTHTNIYGAAYYAYLIAHDLAASDSALGSYVLPGIAPPDISTLVPNPNYVPSPYLPPVKGTLWTTTDPWIGSVFGDVGGASKISDGSFSIVETAASPLTVAMRSGTTTAAAGKIATATDGIAFDFQQVPIDKDFSLSATATVTSITYNNSQVGFGLMVRDAAWVDTFDPSLLSSYVAAGTLKGNSPTTAWSSFERDLSGSPQLTGTTVSSPTVVPAAGSVIDLKIVKTGDVYTCTYGTEDPAIYTIDLNVKDSAYVYAGLFTARECEVAFSNVDLTITN